jgi:hypothetical protein
MAGNGGNGIITGPLGHHRNNALAEFSTSQCSCFGLGIKCQYPIPDRTVSVLSFFLTLASLVLPQAVLPE